MENPNRKIKCLNPLVIKTSIKDNYNIGLKKDEYTSNPNAIKSFQDDANKKPINILAPCGKCFLCLKKRTTEWFIRYKLERNSPEFINTSSLFITLTYDEEHNDINSDNISYIGSTPVKHLNYSDFQLFMKRLRKHYCNDKIKFMCVGEYGMKSYRRHFHALIFGFNNLEDNYKYIISSLWNKGFIDIKPCDDNAVFYLLKYSFKSFYTSRKFFIDNGIVPPMFRVSQGFGKQYALSNSDKLIKDMYIRIDGYTYAIPRYFIKLFRKMEYIYGFDMLPLIEQGITNYISDIYSKFGINLGIDVNCQLCLYDLLHFVSTVKPYFSEINNELFRKHFLSFMEKI